MSVTKRVIAILVIFVFTAIAWMILGATIFDRTYGRDESLHQRVSSTWGTAQTQMPPTASYIRKTREKVNYQERGQTRTRIVETSTTETLPAENSQINVDLALQHRQKGLLWYSTYKVNFSGEYTFRNPSTQAEEITFALPLPAQQAIYDDLSLSVNGIPAAIKSDNNLAIAVTQIPAGGIANLKASYHSQGLDEWHYKFSDEIAQVHDFHLNMTTDFQDIDFPDNTLSPGQKRQTASGWQLQWDYKNLLSGYQIGMTMPVKLQPGPVAGRISFFAPVSLFFFFFLVFIITTLRRIDLHPMNYFFLAAAFFSFHLLMAYLVDHVSIHAAFAAGAAVSMLLVISYMRLVVGAKFALVECGLAQLVYLVLFSYAFFFKGFTGLAVTIGSIVTLFVLMQMTGRINWAEKFAIRSAIGEIR